MESLRRWISTTRLVALACVTVAACGAAPEASTTGIDQGAGSTPPADVASPAVGSVDACSLLSDAEIQSATGHEVVDRTASTLTQVFPSVCDISLGEAGSLTVKVLPTGGRSLYETSFEPYIGEGISPALDEAVTGLGDKAGVSGDDDLMVLKDDVLFELLYTEFGRSDKLSVVRYLADTVLAKLPCLSAGCAGFTPLPPPSTAAAIDACGLLTTDEIHSATGFEASEGSPDGGVTDNPRCRWTLDTGSALPGTDWVAVEVLPTGGQAKFKFWAQEAFEQSPEHVTGLGDDAIKTATIPGGYFYSVIGDSLLTVSFSLPLSIDDPYPLVQPLVAEALGRV